MLLEEQQIFITGGTGGMGTPLIAMLREAGAAVNIYDREEEGDLIDNIDLVCKSLAQDTPDILINMAGCNDFNHAEAQDYENIIGLNLLVPMRACQAVLPAMKQRNSGQIINIGSMTALIPLPHFTGYAGAKAGLKAFNDSLRRELGGTNISVTHIIPRAVRTAMNEGIRAEINERTHASYDDPQYVAARIFKAILKREREVRFGWPERFFAFLNANFPYIVDRGLQKNRQIGEEILSKHNSHKEREDEKKTSPVHLNAS